MSLSALIGHAVFHDGISVTTFPQNYPQDIFDGILKLEHKFVALLLEKHGVQGGREVAAAILLLVTEPYDAQEIVDSVFGFISSEPSLKSVASQKDLKPALSRLRTLEGLDLRDVDCLEQIFTELWLDRSQSSLT